MIYCKKCEHFFWTQCKNHWLENFLQLSRNRQKTKWFHSVM